MRNVFERFDGEDAGLRAELLVQPAINYALVHNRVPLVRHLSLTNTGDAPADGLRVTLELTGPDGPLAEPWSRSLPDALRPGVGVGWAEFGDFRPEQSRLRGTDEAYPVDYRLTVTRDDEPLLTLTAPSSVLAHNEWFNTPGLYDSLAAFVQPNTRAVEGIVRAAARILLTRTGSGSVQGYQAGPERAVQIAGAVYEALRQLGLTYQGLPASFEETGQKVRTTAAVLDARLGNCLDLSVTYAACLEAAGLHPLIWLAAGHAFAGFLLEEERLGSSTVTEANLLISMVESGRAVPVELTLIGPGAGGADFTAAVQAGLVHFRTVGQAPRGVLDVHLAHRSGIRPMPSTDEVTTETDSAASGVDGDPAAAGAIELPDGGARVRLRQRMEEADDSTVLLAQAGDTAPARVQRWKKSLLDLSLRNPLLNLPRRGRGLDLHVPVGALATLDDLIHDGQRLEIVPQDAISQVHQLAGTGRAQDLDPEMLIRELRGDRRIYGAVTELRYRPAMRALQRDARTMEQETGSNYLYLTLGTLVHLKADGGEAHAPLFLLPVRIEGGAGHRPYHLVVDGTEVATPNHCLVEWLRVRHGVRIPELENPVRDDRGIDIPKTLAAVSTRLVDNRLNYRVDERASLRLLQFASFQMWRDLTDHWPRFLENPVVRHLVESSGATFTDPVGADTAPLVDEAELHVPIPADGSQMRAILWAARGQSFVLEGPPGTGKSQTITNLIARALAEGRSVLFVAEKQAALDVVKRRLQQIGLAPFALDLHGRKQSMKAIRDQLRAAMEQHDPGDDETAWTAVETSYRTRLAPLVAYPEQVHGRNPAGLSAWSAYEGTLAHGDGPSAPVPTAHLSVPDAQRHQVETTLREFPAAARSARLRPGHPWALSGRRDLAGLHPDAVTALAADLAGARRAVAGQPEVDALLRGLADPDDIARLLPAAELAARGELPDRAAAEAAVVPDWPVAVARLRAAVDDFHRGYAAELATFRPAVLTAFALDTWHIEAQEAGSRFFGRSRRLRTVAAHLTPFLLPGAAPVTADDVRAVLARLVAARAVAAELRERATAIAGLPVPADWTPTEPTAGERLAYAEQAATTARDLLTGQPEVFAAFARGLDPAAVDVLDRTAAAWRAWRGVLAAGPAELRLWAGELHWYDAWARDGDSWHGELTASGLLPLRRWATVLAYADTLAEAGLAEFREQLLTGRTAADVAEEAYRRGTVTTSLAERLRDGGLDWFDAELHDAGVREYERAADRLRAALPERLPSVLVRRRPFDTAERQGRFADFAAELRRRRGGRSFRELFQRYPDVVLALTPCVLVSPASAATFLAPDAVRFDLVVFDEASQIRVAEAVGAMGRGGSAVIVGDSRQMPPTAIMQVSQDGDEIEVPDDADGGPVPEDLESILSEAVESGLPQQWLSWHYRSRDESLIAFSNRYYYDSRLSSLPSPGAAGSAVRWRRVDGRFDRGGSRTNEIEARAVVAEIARRLADPATAAHSVGVVTFNIQQRDLILNLLEESTDPLVRAQMSAAATEPVFVKNLENVQGDERDVVLFSLAFSTNPETGQLPLNFGPLNQAGGERRLNVAVTRARREVLLFASFDPADIDLSRTAALGTRHLRAYCEMAASGVTSLGDLAVSGAGRRDRVRDEVAEAIRARGHEVRTEYGLSDFTVDIAVRAPGAAHWQVAVMLDGPRWSRRPTVADRDGAPALLRTIMGWPEVVRFWLPAWIQQRDEFLDRVDEAVVRAGQAVPAASEPAARERIPEQRAEEIAPTDAGTPAEALGADSGRPIAPEPFVPYLPEPVGVRGDLDGLATDEQVRERVRAALTEVIAAEAPVEQHRLARLTLARFGLSKTREDRRMAVLGLLDPALFHRHPEWGDFVWPAGVDPATWRGLRVTRSSGDRAVEEICPEEAANALVHALTATESELSESELVRAAVEVLGYRRRTEKLDRLLRHGLRLAEEAGRLQRRDGRWRAAVTR